MKNRYFILYLLIINMLITMVTYGSISTSKQSVKVLDTSRQYSTVALSYQSDLLKKDSGNHQSSLGLDLGIYNSINKLSSIYFGATLTQNNITNNSSLEQIYADYTINHNTLIDQATIFSVTIPTQGIFNSNTQDYVYGDLRLGHGFYYKNYSISMLGTYKFYQYLIDTNSNYNFPYILSLKASAEYNIYSNLFLNLNFGINKYISYKGNQINHFSSSQSLNYYFNDETYLTLGHLLDDNIYNSYSILHTYKSSYFFSFSREF